ncbi:DNA polymerase III subunit alpha [Gleimia hominis]|uniref:DNA polymerase III subunit alpha n=1 Tax=Gleimia hominis TaxID=595468 RepID=UPI000C7FE7D8|nr:DNA polymerase III subunit alpha [Gleimia hominis]WIK65227.1 DNA polymerase III subunit alpha [Gleimia hominis]
MAKDQFVHLHNHTEYSMLDGASKLKPLVEEAARLNQEAIAITDHGYLFGAYEFYTEAKAAGVKPIVGLEAYMTPGISRFEQKRVLWGEEWQRRDDVSARGAYTHLTLIAETTEGMHNLFRMGSLASLEGQMGKWPRIDMELLERYSKGLIAFTGCPSSEVQTRLRLGQWDEAVAATGRLKDIFGKDNLYVELMDHGIEIERRTKADLLKLSKHMGLPPVVTNDAHYVRKEDRDIQDALLCINSGSTLNDPDRFRFDGSGYYIRSSEDMRNDWLELPQACDNTLEIARRCDITFRTTADGANFMPRFPVPQGEDETSWFVKEVERGLISRFPSGVPDHVRKQAEYEVGIITQMGFPGYFLVVSDFIRWAKSQNIRVGPGRGSGAGSMVAYAMHITDLNPLEHGLIFERFLNPERVSMPDFDVDFDERRRGEVIEYVTQKYGDDRVAQVVTYGKIKAKQALKDSARVQGLPYSVGEKLTKAMPPSVMGKDITVSGIFDPNDKRYDEAAEFRRLHAEEPDTHPVVEMAKGLEGITRQWGVHACAVIMSSAPLQDIIPMMKRPADGAIITQFDYPTCESLGLLKMDFLGLRNLTVLSDTIENIGLNGKKQPDLQEVPLDDQATFKLLSTGETLGVFQLDGDGMQKLLKRMRPNNFEDISAVGALYRPGPMGADSHNKYADRKNGRAPIEPIHPELAEPLKDILGTTYGLIVYQEQVMAIAQKLAGYTLGQADLLRRAMGKKKKEILDKEYVPFRQGMIDHGYSEDAVKTLWDILVPFSNYAFNKAHSAAYGLVSYWTAWLKTHYPVEFMAALLTSQKDNKDKLSLYLSECRRMGITVLPPDVNSSEANFTAVGEDIRFGLAAVRNVGGHVVDGITATRKERRDYEDFTDFLDKVPTAVCNKRTIESLIKAGAFDAIEPCRRALVAIHEEAVDSSVKLKRNEAAGQFDLFASATDMGMSAMTVEVPQIPEWPKKEKLAFEREMLGLYVSDHPLSGVNRALARYQDQEISQLVNAESLQDRQSVKVAGLITAVAIKTTRKGELWATATLEDLSGSVNILFFPRTYQTISHALSADLIVQVEGQVLDRDSEVSIAGQTMTILDLREDGTVPVVLDMPWQFCTTDRVEMLRDILSAHPGPSPVHMRIKRAGTPTILAELGQRYRVNTDSSFYSDLKATLGPAILAD